MLVDPSNYTAGSTVTGAIRQASAATGTSFNYLLATAQVESGLNPQAGATTSSARGLFQFIEQTWLGTIKQSGAELGYGHYADAISKTSSGHYQVTDPAMRAEILKLRNDPTANAVMAGAFTKANADYLATKLNRQPSEGELYIAHFLGAGGAARLISLAAANPNAKASDYFPNAANANSSIFYDRATGRARSLAQVRDVLTARYDVARNDPRLPRPQRRCPIRPAWPARSPRPRRRRPRRRRIRFSTDCSRIPIAPRRLPPSSANCGPRRMRQPTATARRGNRRAAATCTICSATPGRGLNVSAIFANIYGERFVKRAPLGSMLQ